MESGTTIVGIIIVIICIIPFALISFKRRKHTKRQLSRFIHFAEKNNRKVSRFDVWNNAAIGIDDAARTVFYTRNSGDQKAAQHIQLADISKCRIVNTGRAVNNKGGNYSVVDKLELGFSFHDNRNEIFLELYNVAHDNLTLNGELQLGEKWCKIVNDKIADKEK